jgi:hypothetical protein
VLGFGQTDRRFTSKVTSEVSLILVLNQFL